MPFDSLFIGVTGLGAYQNQIDVISNNIANVGTTGFKGQRVTFQDLLYQQQQFASGPSQTRGGVNSINVGLGVKTGTVDTVFQQGGLQTTGINTDLAINGDGFFILRNADGSGVPVYTRDGAFSLNSNGLLYDGSSGLAVQGYLPNAQGQLTQSGVPGPLRIPLGLKSQAIGTGFGVKGGPSSVDKVFDVTFGGNLDQSQWIKEEQGVATSNTPGNGSPATISTTIYDSLGNGHLMTISYVPDATGATGTSTGLPATVAAPGGTATVPSTRWKIVASFSDGTTFSDVNGANVPSGSTGTLGYAFFDKNGQYINSSGNVNGTGAHAVGATPAAAQGNYLAVTTWGPGNVATATTASPGAIGLDYSTMSGLSGTSTATTLAQNGFQQGTLNNLTISQDGTIVGTFSNGQNQSLGAVAVATFQNEDGLNRLGANQFSQSVNSGLAQVGTATVGKFGSIISGSLEQSNVSLADEFTKLILAQRSFEANTKSITTADENLQQVLQLKR